MKHFLALKLCERDEEHPFHLCTEYGAEPQPLFLTGEQTEFLAFVRLKPSKSGK